MKKTVSITIILFFALSFSKLSAQDSIYHRAKIWEKDIQRFSDADKQQFPQEKSILFVGSSSFTLWDTLQESFPNHRIINRGFGGSMLADVLYFAEQIVFPYKPAQIVLYEGDNDIVGGMSAEAFMEDVKAFVRLVEIRLPGVPVLLLSPKNSPSRDNFSSEYNKAAALLFDFARTKTHVQFVDVSTLLRDARGNFIKEYFKSDMLHLNEKGYAVWTHQLEPYLVHSK